MFILYNVWLFMTDHGHGAIIEFIVDVGDHAVTHVLAVLVFKAGAARIGIKIARRLRKRKLAKAAASK